MIYSDFMLRTFHRFVIKCKYPLFFIRCKGHLRSTIIGDSLARLLEFLGHDVIRLIFHHS